MTVQAIFDEFFRLAEEVNKTANDEDLIVSVYRPEYEYELSNDGIAHVPPAKISVCKGHISTRSWALLVQGYVDTIEIYILPAENLLLCTLNEIHDIGLHACMLITSELVGGQLEWRIGEKVISFDVLPLLAKELIENLISVASGEKNDQDFLTNCSMDSVETSAQSIDSLPALANSSVATAAQTLSTWIGCRELVEIISTDLSKLAEKDHDAKDSCEKENVESPELSSDLRSLSASITGILDKYTNCEHTGSS